MDISVHKTYDHGLTTRYVRNLSIDIIRRECDVSRTFFFFCTHASQPKTDKGPPAGDVIFA